MKKFVTIVPILRVGAVLVILAISTYVTVKIFLYESPYKNLESKIQLVNNKIKIKDFSIKIYPSDGHEIWIRSKQYQTSINDLNKHSFINVQTSFK